MITIFCNAFEVYPSWKFESTLKQKIYRQPNTENSLRSRCLEMMGVVENGASSHVRLAHTIVSCTYITLQVPVILKVFGKQNLIASINNRIRCYKLLKKGCNTVLNISMFELSSLT